MIDKFWITEIRWDLPNLKNYSVEARNGFLVFKKLWKLWNSINLNVSHCAVSEGKLQINLQIN